MPFRKQQYPNLIDLVPIISLSPPDTMSDTSMAECSWWDVQCKLLCRLISLNFTHPHLPSGVSGMLSKPMPETLLFQQTFTVRLQRTCALPAYLLQNPDWNMGVFVLW